MLEYFKERKDVFHDNDEIIDMLVWCKNEKCVDGICFKRSNAKSSGFVQTCRRDA